jgi:hypothetical protein
MLNRTDKTPWKLAVFLGLVAIAIWISYPFIIKCFFGDWQARGQFGDTFGALSCLFSLLAFCGVLYTIVADRKHKRQESLRNSYEVLLVAIEHQLKAEQTTKNDPSSLQDLIAKQAYYAKKLEEEITARSPGPLLSDEDIVNAFSKIPWFIPAELARDTTEIRRRLRSWSIDPDELPRLVNDVSIKKIITDMYLVELKRPNEAPFDPHALATWGGMIYRNGTSQTVVDQIRNNLRKSPEWKEKNK